MGDRTAEGAAEVVAHARVEFDRIGVAVTGVLTNHGPEFVDRDVTTSDAAKASATADFHREPNHDVAYE